MIIKWYFIPHHYISPFCFTAHTLFSNSHSRCWIRFVWETSNTKQKYESLSHNLERWRSHNRETCNSSTMLCNVIILYITQALQALNFPLLETFGCCRCSDSHNWPLVEYKWGIWTLLSHEASALPSDTCISRGRECQRMLGGLFHMWPALLSFSLSLSLSSNHLPLPGRPCSRNQVWLKVFRRTWGPLLLLSWLPPRRLGHTRVPGQRHLDRHQCRLQRWPYSPTWRWTWKSVQWNTASLLTYHRMHIFTHKWDQKPLSLEAEWNSDLKAKRSFYTHR